MTHSSTFWLVKQEPTKYPFSQLLKDGRTMWDGVRNFQARNHLRAMKKGDLVFYYHSVKEKAIVGLCKVVREAYPDATATQGDWSAVDLEPISAAPHPLTLSEIKQDPALSNMALIRQSRLSVMPVTSQEAERILHLTGLKP